jgi:hypothetical protein
VREAMRVKWHGERAISVKNAAEQRDADEAGAE